MSSSLTRQYEGLTHAAKELEEREQLVIESRQTLELHRANLIRNAKGMISGFTKRHTSERQELLLVPGDGPHPRDSDPDRVSGIWLVKPKRCGEGREIGVLCGQLHSSGNAFELYKTTRLIDDYDLDTLYEHLSWDELFTMLPEIERALNS